LFLSSCGGDDLPSVGTGGTGTSQTGVTIGSSPDGTFQEGVVAIGTTNLSSGGSTSITVQLRTTDGSAYTESAEITFSSDCQSASRAEIEEPTITTTLGTASTTYNDLGCSGSDTITARTNAGGDVLTATASLTVAAPTLGSIEFVSAEPSIMGLKGTGAAGIKETSTVKFRVLNDVGGAMPDQEVAFSLTTAAGGLNIAADSATSGSDGAVSVIVRAGTIPTSVRVTATVIDTNIATQSSGLTVSTAIPDRDSFSLSAETYNPEAWGFDNAEVQLTVLAADRFNNPVPDGTAIVFTTELGAVVSQCQTVGGACSATWRSQNPRIDFGGGTSGRTTIIAHAVGEETFEDENGNGVFDGDTDCATASPGEECFYDLSEAWRDDNEDGLRDAPNEDYVDFNSNGSHDGPDGRWNGIVCGGSDCTAELKTISDSIVLVMARSAPSILFFDGSGAALSGTQNLPTTITTCIAGAGTFETTAGGTLLRGQTMPAGTTISFSATVGTITSSRTDVVIPSNNDEAPDCYAYTINDSESGDAGSFEVTVSAPNGQETFASVNIQDTAAAP
jgi:hypothetical protein